ncbi:MAG: hypothetical protein JXR36_04305 [Bacteroidales bacterium]|nr:hypothetical protein [Bacteroidales bacterium]
MQSKKIIISVCFALLGLIAMSQEISENTKISICEGYLEPQKALEIIEQKYDIKFSYNPNLFNIRNEIYLCKKNKNLKDILSIILGKPVELILKNDYIIIKPSKIVNYETSSIYKTIRINGIVENATNGMPLENAVIETMGYKFYTNETGYFSIKINILNDSLTLFINKENYIGYKANIVAESQNIKIRLLLKNEVDYTYMPSSIKDKNSKIENYWFSSLILSANQTELSRGRKVLLDREFQFSLVPSVGMYNMQSGMYRYHRSYNILAGYTGEIYGHEIGLGVNIVRYDMTGIQFAGIANIVGGEISGLQFSTGANVCIGNVRGVQLAAAANTTWGHFKGMQISGGANLVKSKLRGYQIAPVNIVLDTLLGCQTGIVNISASTAKGAQLGILLNYSPQNDFLQYSTFLNISKQNKASQIGLVNVSGNVSNLQIGLLNFADTVSGVSIGFLSFVKNGYTNLDFSLNTSRFVNLSFKTGTFKFYNIIKAGIRPEKETDVSIGYGFGRDFGIWRFFSISTDLAVSHVFENNAFNLNLNLLGNVDLLLNFNIGHKFSIFTGLETKFLFTDSYNLDGTFFESTIPPSNLWFDKTYQNHRAYIWPQIKIGFRI